MIPTVLQPLSACRIFTVIPAAGSERDEGIQKKLGEMNEGHNEVTELERKIAKAGMPKEVRGKVNDELNKLKMTSPMLTETAIRNTKPKEKPYKLFDESWLFMLAVSCRRPSVTLSASVRW